MIPLIIFAIFYPILLAEGLSFDDVAGTVSLSISQGELLGKRIDSYENRSGYGFLGVPFGAPPVNSLRFAKPVAAPAWKGVRNVTVKGDACPAGPLTYKRPEGGPMSEDCLHVYVYSSKNCLTKGGCAIMWVLHGGRYNFESPVLFDDDALVHNFASDCQDVVVIIPAYRLMNFGFLNIAPGMNTSAPPNVAVWDLLLAMQWTHREAHHFGGDPGKITIHGHSAGAQFSDVVSTSPHFDGLFRGIVMMSGADSAYEAGPESNSLASWLTAKLLGCATDDTDRSDAVIVETVIACLRTKSWEEIVASNEELGNFHLEQYYGPHADGPGGILPLSPKELSSKRAPINMMIGTTSAEFHDTKYAINANGTANLIKVAELCEMLAYGLAYADPIAMTKKCLDHYMQGDNVMNFQGDIHFFIPSFVAARDMAKTGKNVYLYSFTYQGVGAAFNSYYSGLEKEDHPAHSEDYVYIIGMHRANFTPRDYEIEKIYSGMVLNFIKTGYPNPGPGQPAWRPFTELGKDYYEIDFDDSNQMPGMKKGYNADAIDLWVYDAPKYGGSVTPPDELPPGVDRFYPFDVSVTFANHHTNSWKNSDYYKIWTYYITYRRLKYLQGLSFPELRSIAFDEEDVTGAALPASNNIVQLSLEIIVICFFAFLIFLLLRCCLHCDGVTKERKGYEQF